jgi:NADPH:quinone reductase-like Zn-dependent oxidoreductase
MKAVVIHEFGGNEVVQIEDLPQPSPGLNDVLIRVRAASVNPVDWKVRYGHARIFSGGKFPKILGNECSGEVIEIGSQVRKFKKSDPVVCYSGVRRLGAFAENACAPERCVFPKPQNVSFEEAACIPIAGLTALQALRDHGRIASGNKVLINGAAGGVGHFAVQIAKTFGTEVTGVCSGPNAGLVKSLGADRVIDYRSEDFTKGSEHYDIIFDAVAKSSFGRCRKVLAPKGIYISTLPAFSVIVNQYITGFFTGKKARSMWVKVNAADMEWVKTQIETNRIRIVIDKVFPLDQAREALAYSESGKVKGKIVITMI